MQAPGNLLIVAYYWPPSGGAGVQRWLKLSKELVRLGWTVHVLTVDTEDATFPHWDETLLADVAPGIQVHRTPAFNPIDWGKKLIGKHADQVASADLKASATWLSRWAMRVRTHAFVPDPRKGWNRSAVAKGIRLVEELGIDWVITTSPPHSSQLIGKAIKERTGVNWLADFRDPWTDVFYYDLLLHSAWSAALDARYEHQVMRGADMLLVVHDKYRERLADKYPGFAPEKLRYLPNGFDEEDFQFAEATGRSEHFELVYTGVMASGYEPEVVMEGIRICSLDRPVRLTLVGTAPESIINGFRAVGCEVQALGMQPHHVANAWQQRADVLLCLIPAIPGAELAHVPGKVYEYLATRKPILNIGPVAGETASILNRCGAGVTCERTDASPVARFLEAVAQGQFAVTAASEPHISAYARSAQAAQLDGWLRRN